MQDLHIWLALSHCLGLKVKLLEHWQKQRRLADIFVTPIVELKSCGFSDAHIASFKTVNWKQIDREKSWLIRHGYQFIPYIDSKYPPLLKEIHHPPVGLYVAGEVALLAQAQLAIVGSRNPTPTGRTLARQFASELAELGLIITSGLALGIDGESHRGALAVGGKTIAVLGAGLQVVYPKSHQSLSTEIINKGALVSEFPLMMPPKANHFPMRNRIISGLSHGTLVVEARARSGSLITAKFALEQNREVFALPGSVFNIQSAGCHQLIRQGATLVEKKDDILEELNLTSVTLPINKKQQDVKAKVDFTVSMQRVYKEIGYELTPMNMLLERTRLTFGELSSILLTLELGGYVVTVPGGYIRKK